MPRKRLADLLREEATKALVNEGNVPVEPTLETQITTLTSELDQARKLGLDLQNQVVDLQQQLQRQFFRADNLERDLIELQVVKAELNQAKRVIEELSEIRVALEQTALEHVVVETVIPPDGTNATERVGDLGEPSGGDLLMQGISQKNLPYPSAQGIECQPVNVPSPNREERSDFTEVSTKPLKSSIKVLRSHSLQLGLATRRLNNEDMGWVD